MPARILIVDDTIPSAKVLSAKLTGEYYDVLTAVDGPSALQSVADNDPDLVLLDVMMPGMDGFEVCRKIKGETTSAHIPVVMVTALSDISDRVAGLEAGADDFLTKPVSDTLLFARVASLVRLKRMLDQWRLRQETSGRIGLKGVADSAFADNGDRASVALVSASKVETANIRDTLAVDADNVQVFDPAAAELAIAIADADADVIVVSVGDEEDKALRLASLLRSQEKTRQVPILLLGDEEEMDVLLKALELGVNDFVVRPIDSHELLARVRTQVRRKRYQDRLQKTFVQSISMALTDALTGLHNRHYLSSHLESVMTRMQMAEKPVSLLMVDLDHFKSVNDQHGHLVGDAVLVEIAQRIARNIRGFDLAARYGGEEFVVMMPDTPIDVAKQVADRLREFVGDVPIVTKGKELTVTLSVGVAAMAPGDSPDALLERADKALYEAKNGGRNRTIVAPDPTQKPH